MSKDSGENTANDTLPPSSPSAWPRSSSPPIDATARSPEPEDNGDIDMEPHTPARARISVRELYMDNKFSSDEDSDSDHIEWDATSVGQHTSPHVPLFAGLRGRTLVNATSPDVPLMLGMMSR